MKRDIKNKLKKIKDLLIKPLAIVGLLAILGILIFSINFITKGNSYFSSASVNFVNLSSFFSKKENLFVSADSLNQKSGEIFKVFFKHPDSKAIGSYSFTYPCFESFYFEAITDSNKKEKVLCNTPFSITNTDNEIKIRANLTQSRYVDMPVTVSFTPNGKSTPTSSGSITLSISNENILNDKQQENIILNNTKSDLKITIAEIGVLNRETKAFVKLNSISKNDVVGIRFIVENIGSKLSGPWKFNAILPTYPSKIFNSEIEPSLNPQDRIEFTIGFDQAIVGKQIVKFLVDPDNAVSEISEENNTASVEIQIL